MVNVQVTRPIFVATQRLVPQTAKVDLAMASVQVMAQTSAAATETKA